MLEAFEDTSLGNLNTIERDGTLYVPAIERAMILGYRNPRDAIRRHCVCDTITVDEWVITGKKADGSDAMQCVHKKYINESDFMTKRRPNGDGMIRKRADGRWEGRIIVGHKENGKPIYKSVLAKTQKKLIPRTDDGNAAR